MPGKVASPGARCGATTLAAWRSTCTPTRRRATAPRRRPSWCSVRSRPASTPSRSPTTTRPSAGPRPTRRGAGARHPAGAAASRSRAAGGGRASTCWPTCPTPTHPELVAELARARDSRDTRLDRMVAADGGGRHPDHGGVGARRGRGRRDGGPAAHRRRARHRRRRASTATRRSRAGSATTAPTTSRTTPPTRCARSSWCGPPGECRSSPTRGRARAGGSWATPSSRRWPTPGSPASRCTTATTPRRPCAT